MSQTTIDKLRPMIEASIKSEEDIKSASMACWKIFRWVTAVVKYDEVSSDVTPKKNMLELIKT